MSPQPTFTSVQSALDDSDPPTVIFLHIGKTAGSTLRRIVRRNYPRSRTIAIRTLGRPRELSLTEFAKLSESTRAGARLVYGHTPFGIHESIPRPSTYITMIRHPVSLALSQYAFVRRTPNHRLHHAASTMTLLEYVESGVADEMSNSQTRALAGATTFTYGDNPQAVLDRALKNIEHHFSVVGITERFDESLVLLRRRLNWRTIYYASANVAPSKPELTAGALELIREYNQNDLALYEQLGARFDRSIDGAPGFPEEVARFQRRNALYRPASRAALAVTYVLPRTIRRATSRWRAGLVHGAGSSS